MKFSSKEKEEFILRYQGGERISDICIKEKIPKSTFYSWISKYQYKTVSNGTVINANEFYKLKQKNEKLEQIIEILQKVNCTTTSPLKDKLCELELLHNEYSVNSLCKALNVDRGTFYNHLLRNKKENNSYKFKREELSEKILNIFHDNNQIYGAKKIKAILERGGTKTSDRMVSELMNEMNLKSLRSSAKKDYDRYNKETKKDLLNLQFNVTKPNDVWVSDVTYFKYKQEFYYICVIIDLYARKALACKISQKHSAQLITSTFKSAYKNRNPEDGLIFHSDRGSQYLSYSFREILKSYGIKQSLSPAGKPKYNAVMESFFSSMKKEELYRVNFRSANEFKNSVEKYIAFYNNERPHSSNKFKTPNELESLYFKELQD